MEEAKKGLIPIDWSFDDETKDLLEDLAIKTPIELLQALSNLFKGVMDARGADNETCEYVAEHLFNISQTLASEKLPPKANN